MTDILYRLQNPPFGTETSERNLMSAAAAEIERLLAALKTIAEYDYAQDLYLQRVAREALGHQQIREEIK